MGAAAPTHSYVMSVDDSVCRVTSGVFKVMAKKITALNAGLLGTTMMIALDSVCRVTSGVFKVMAKKITALNAGLLGTMMIALDPVSTPA